MSEIIEFVRLATAAEEIGWHPRHLYRVLTEPSWSHLDPRPPLRRIGGRGFNTLLRSEWEIFKQRVADEGLKRPPKKTKMSKALHQARLDREAAAAP
jgi:hypothetical protein